MGRLGCPPQPTWRGAAATRNSVDTVTYDVYFGTSNPPTALLCNDVSSATCDPGTLSYSTHYYWHVIATDNHGASTTGPNWDFYTVSAPSVGPVVYDSYFVDDDIVGNSSGNDNGVADCGENIELYVDLHNQGSQAATGMNATISTNDPYVGWLYNTSSRLSRHHRGRDWQQLR